VPGTNVAQSRQSTSGGCQAAGARSSDRRVKGAGYQCYPGSDRGTGRKVGQGARGAGLTQA